MFKFIVMVLASLMGCFLILHFCPGVVSTAFTVQGHQVTWMMLAAVGLLLVTHRIVSSK